MNFIPILFPHFLHCIFTANSAIFFFSRIYIQARDSKRMRLKIHISEFFSASSSALSHHTLFSWYVFNVWAQKISILVFYAFNALPLYTGLDVLLFLPLLWLLLLLHHHLLVVVFHPSSTPHLLLYIFFCVLSMQQNNTSLSLCDGDDISEEHYRSFETFFFSMNTLCCFLTVVFICKRSKKIHDFFSFATQLVSEPASQPAIIISSSSNRSNSTICIRVYVQRLEREETWSLFYKCCALVHRFVFKCMVMTINMWKLIFICCFRFVVYPYIYAC